MTEIEYIPISELGLPKNLEKKLAKFKISSVESLIMTPGIVSPPVYKKAALILIRRRVEDIEISNEYPRKITIKANHVDNSLITAIDYVIKCNSTYCCSSKKVNDNTIIVEEVCIKKIYYGNDVVDAFDIVVEEVKKLKESLMYSNVQYGGKENDMHDIEKMVVYTQIVALEPEIMSNILKQLSMKLEKGKIGLTDLRVFYKISKRLDRVLKLYKKSKNYNSEEIKQKRSLLLDIIKLSYNVAKKIDEFIKSEKIKPKLFTHPDSFEE